MKLKKFKFYTIFLFYTSINTFGQAIPPPPGNQDPAGASIDDSIPLLIATGIIFGSYIVKIKKSKS